MRLILQHLAKTYPPNVVAVDDVSLDVDSGELVVLLGPSGCGKTTLLRLIAGLERPDGGSIQVDGRPVDRLPPHRRDVAMVFQHDVLYPHLSVHQNMAFGLRLRGTPKSDVLQRVRQAVDVLQIADLSGRRPGELSGGQRQRAALGRAMVRQPKIFLLDEPLSRLDAALRVQLRREIRQLHERLDAATILVTHDQEEALSLGDRVAVMRDGRIEQVADPRTLYQRPTNRFVASMTGTPAVNLLPVRLEAAEGLLVAVGPTFRLPLPAARRPSLQRALGKTVWLGLRPEHIRVEPAHGDCPDFRDEVAENGTVPFSRPPGPCLEGRLERLELAGAACYADVCVGGTRLTVRADGQAPFVSGQTVRLRLDLDQALFFDVETEKNLLHEKPP